MDRRRFAGGVALGFIVDPLAAHAQRAAKVPRVGILTLVQVESPEMRLLLDAFRKGLREHGYVEGQNIIIEYRSADGKFEQLASMASELVHLKVDVIVVGVTAVARAAQQVTTTIPIVTTGMGDPIEDGLAVSLARPGGNVTGLTYLGQQLVLKRLELLKDMLPTVSRMAVLWGRDAFGERTVKELSEADAAARRMGIQLQLVEVRGPRDLDGAFSAITREHSHALVVVPGAVLFVERKRIVEFATAHRLPAMYFMREFVALGGLASYGPNYADLVKRSTTYVDKILRGAKPGDLPIEQPTEFELVISLKTAKALGLTIPQSLLQRADEVIQ